MKKFFISLLLICGVALPCFSNAVDNTRATINWSQSYGWSNGSVDTTNLVAGEVMCFSVPCDNASVDIGDGYTLLTQGLLYCYNYSQAPVVKLKNNCGSSQSFNYVRSKGGMGGGYIMPSECSAMSSLECQTEYNLIPISSVDQNYCTTNNLCPSSDIPVCPDNPNIGTSNLYINDVFHPGAFNVIVNIPEEIDWDYAYTNSGSNFNLDIVGYNQDFELIEDWIATNNYKPTSDDFTNIFTSGFSNLGGLLVSLLLVIVIFYLVKKLF